MAAKSSTKHTGRRGERIRAFLCFSNVGRDIRFRVLSRGQRRLRIIPKHKKMSKKGRKKRLKKKRRQRK